MCSHISLGLPPITSLKVKATLCFCIIIKDRDVASVVAGDSCSCLYNDEN
jgi:hypothetical protein